MSITVRPSQLKDILRFSIENRDPLLISGPPGVGKSEIVEQVTKEMGADLLISHPVISDPTDFKGLPWPDAKNETATFLPFGDLAAALAVRKLTVWFLDDLGHAPVSVQAASMQLVLGGRINGRTLPRKKVVFIAATNRRMDKAGVQSVIEPLKSRFTIVELQPGLDDWVSWALHQKAMVPEVPAFLRFRPALLMDFKPTTDMSNSPNPRMWARVGRKLAKGLPKSLMLPHIAGCVGEGAAGEFVSFYQMAQELPSVESILLRPNKAPIPKEESVLYALVMGLVHRATSKVAEGLFRYASRLSDEGKGEFAMLLVKDSVAKHPEITNTRAFGKLVHGSKFGKVLGVVS